MITILGQVPAKKNSRQAFVRAGRVMNVPNKTYTEWEKQALWQLKGTKPVTEYPVALSMTFYVKDNRGRDMDNMLASVLDCLQKAGVLANDDWQHCRPITIDCGGIDKLNPRVEITWKASS